MNHATETVATFIKQSFLSLKHRPVSNKIRGNEMEMFAKELHCFQCSTKNWSQLCSQSVLQLKQNKFCSGYHVHRVSPWRDTFCTEGRTCFGFSTVTDLAEGQRGFVPTALINDNAASHSAHSVARVARLMPGSHTSVVGSLLLQRLRCRATP